MGDDAPVIPFNGDWLDRAGVLAALEGRAARIAGELDRVRIDCGLPYVAERLGLWAGELQERAASALDSDATQARVVIPPLLAALDALVRDVCMVESSTAPADGFPTYAQSRALLLLLRAFFGEDAHAREGCAYVLRDRAAVPDGLLVGLADGSAICIARDGQMSPRPVASGSARRSPRTSRAGERLSRPILARLTQIAAVALARGFTIEAEPIDMDGGTFVYIRKQRDSGTVYVNRLGECERWRTGGRSALQQLKATLEQLNAARP